MQHSFAGPIRLLHVDDDTDMAELTATFLERENEQFVVETATGPAEGLDRLAEADFDCVVSDYDMPRRNGIEFLEAVRDEFPDLPFVLFTGKGSEEIASEAISAGVTDYLQKGTGSDQYTVLTNRVRNAVEQYRSRRALETNRKRLSLLFEQSPLGVVEWTESFEVVRANDTAAEIFGYDADELVGESWETLVPESERDGVQTVMSDLLEAEGGYHSVDENVRKDGDRIVCEWHNRIVTEDDGSVVAIFSQIRDVTEEYRRRQRQERQREALVELATDEAVVAGDFRTALQRITETAADVLDVSRVNVWLFGDDGDTANCVDHYDRPSDSHETDMALSMAEYPTYRETLRSEWVISADDARSDPRTAELTDDYLDVHDVDALLDATLRSEGEFVGFVCHEHVGGPREWTDDETRFAADVADIVRRALRNRDRNERQRELREERAFIDQALDTLDDVFYVVNTDGELRRWNERLRTVLGYEPEEIAGRNAVEFFPEDERTAVVDAFEEMLSTGQVTIEAEVLTAEGERIPYEFTNTRLTDSEGDLVGLVGVARDVTQRREREREMEFFTQIVESVGVGVAVYRADGCYEYVNDAYGDLLGTDAETLTGTPIWEVNPRLDPERFTEYWEGFQVGATRIDETVHNYEDVEVPVQTVTTCREIRGTTYHFGTITDITERKEREREIQRQNERLDEFASIVSHDLRNPLQVASGHLDIAQRECDSESLDTVADAHDRMKALISDLLTLAREGEAVHEPEAVDLASVASDCWATVETDDAAFVTESDLTISADPRRLRQLFENLMRNATEHGGDDVTVSVGALDTGDGFYVADDGEGIPEDERGQVFESGWTTAEDGTGFGLSIVEEVAAAHGWDIAVTESADGGAQFEFTGVRTVA